MTTEPALSGSAELSDLSDQTAEFYDISNLILVELWDENFHQGYWLSADDESSNKVATDRLTDLLIEKSGLSAGGRVLDVGCGIGTSAFRLAEATPAQVVGISNNQAQIDEANRRATERGLAGRVAFEYADVLALPYPDASFDVVWVFEALMHMDRTRTLREIRRVLRPGGRVVITDLLQHGELAGEDARLIHEHMAEMQASPLLDADAYRALVAGAGLELAELSDISEHTGKTARRVYDAVNERYDELVAKYGAEAAGLLEVFRNPIGLLPQMGYLIAVAHRPA
ncbi:methyltransferase type 11 [Sphaerisporangium rufum]|uniref:Methyltransferase type 11 n=1 Tax=Sphaerisporangium rufum TaxID=1381558 RepID=A0A919UZF5_9ACTN|nr:methyltransferase domain-containing protein [Sphaerisporangium rufum]GII76242.1 methyltransferase type 11 [Sphaerisporangium rufum]